MFKPESIATDSVGEGNEDVADPVKDAGAVDSGLGVNLGSVSSASSSVDE